MLKLFKKYLFVSSVIYCVLYSINPLFAQEKGLYKGPLRVLDYKGSAVYDYILNGSDTILDGSFKLQSSNLEALLSKKDSTFLIEGAFEKGLANGFWKFQFGVFQANTTSQVIDYQYRISASGIQEEVQGLMDKGKPDGSWEYSVHKIKDAQIQKTLFKSSITFEKGIPQRNFRIENDSMVLAGRFLRSGFAQDEWVIYGMTEADAMEQWYFSDGLLEKIVLNRDGKEQRIPIFDLPVKRTKTMVLDSRFLELLHLKKSATDYKATGDNMSSLLNQNASYYQKLDTILSQLGSSGIATNFRVRVPYFPMDSLNMVHISSMLKDIKKAGAISDSYLNNTLLNILKLSDSQALALYTGMEIITEDYIVPLQKFVTYKQNGILDFLTPEDILKDLWPNGISAKSLEENEADAPNTGFKSISTLSFDFEEDTMASLAKLANYSYEYVAYIENILKAKLSKEQRQQELIGLEERLLEENKKLEQRIDSVESDLSVPQRKALSAIQAVTFKNLSDFSTQEDFEAAGQLVICYERMNQLSKSIIALPERSKEITTLYNDRIWNPFMATLMDEAVKKRIISAYQKILVPYFLDQVTTKLTCDNVEDLNLLIEATNERMLQLRDKDTKKLERKLKRKDNPLEVLQLLGIKTVQKNTGI